MLLTSLLYPFFIIPFFYQNPNSQIKFSPHFKTKKKPLWISEPMGKYLVSILFKFEKNYFKIVFNHILMIFAKICKNSFSIFEIFLSNSINQIKNIHVSSLILWFFLWYIKLKEKKYPIEIDIWDMRVWEELPHIYPYM